VCSERIADRDDRVSDLAASELPHPSGVSARECAWTCNTAMSVEGSLPAIRAFTLSPFEKLTCTDFAPWITW